MAVQIKKTFGIVGGLGKVPILPEAGPFSLIEKSL